MAKLYRGQVNKKWIIGDGYGTAYFERPKGQERNARLIYHKLNQDDAPTPVEVDIDDFDSDNYEIYLGAETGTITVNFTVADNVQAVPSATFNVTEETEIGQGLDRTLTAESGYSFDGEETEAASWVLHIPEGRQNDTYTVDLSTHTVEEDEDEIVPSLTSFAVAASNLDSKVETLTIPSGEQSLYFRFLYTGVSGADVTGSATLQESDDNSTWSDVDTNPTWTLVAGTIANASVYTDTFSSGTKYYRAKVTHDSVDYFSNVATITIENHLYNFGASLSADGSFLAQLEVTGQTNDIYFGGQFIGLTEDEIDNSTTTMQWSADGESWTHQNNDDFTYDGDTFTVSPLSQSLGSIGAERYFRVRTTVDSVNYFSNECRIERISI